MKLLQLPHFTALALLLAAPLRAQHPDTTGWQDLFAANLSNAQLVIPASAAISAADSWKFENGELVAKNPLTLWTRETYGDFILDLEFKTTKQANSGVFLRSGDIGNVLKALEIQVHENEDGHHYGMVGALYNACPPAKSMAKPVGEWNRYTITCKGSRITLIFNGEQVLDVDLEQWSEAKKNPDGTANKFAVALKDFSRNGPIGLQGLHGPGRAFTEMAPVHYRNLKIKRLD
jgi:hypothetical protein